VLDWAIVSARLLQFGCALVLFGFSLFCIYGFRGDGRGPSTARWDWPELSVVIAATGALFGVLWWVAASAATFFPNTGLFDPSTMWIVLTETGFGQIAFMRIGLLALSIAVVVFLSSARLVWIIQSMLGVLIVASFAWTGHGVFNSGLEGFVHTTADILHLIAAAIWIGALMPLGVLIWRSVHAQTETEAQTILESLDRFSGIGPTLVAVLVFTGLVNSWFLIGIAQWSALFTTEYGIVLIIKLVLFGGMLLLAAINRYHLSPQLRSDLENGFSPARVLRRLRVAVLTEFGLSIIVLSAVAFLGTWEPPIAS
jgi:putative copper resistance protein D